uniref:Weissellicin M n=1 Tax=Weissella hellenica TaxID=46256 RepID=H1A8I6_WEIHE|nr:weissellicin M [Weissella hellenica]
MVSAAKVALKVGWGLVKKYYTKVMQFIGEGWSVDQIADWLKRH